MMEIIFQAKNLKKHELIFLETWKAQKHGFNFLQASKISAKYGFQLLQAYKISQKVNKIFCQRKKAQKTWINFIIPR